MQIDFDIPTEPHNCDINKVLRASWDVVYMTMCYMIAARSEDHRTQYGSIITNKHNHVLSIGVNGFPKGFKSNQSHQDKPKKYYYIEHAERNAIYNAAQNGISLDNAHNIYIPVLPCADCARGIASVGIKRVIIHDSMIRLRKYLIGDGTWDESYKATKDIFDQCGIKIFHLDKPLLSNVVVTISGKRYLYSNKKFNLLTEVL